MRFSYREHTATVSNIIGQVIHYVYTWILKTEKNAIHQFLKTYETHQFCEINQREKLFKLSAIFRSTKFTQTSLNAGVLHTFPLLPGLP